MKQAVYFLALMGIFYVLPGCTEMEDLIAEETMDLKRASMLNIEVQMVPGEMLVKFQEGIDESRKEFLLSKIGARQKELIVTRIMENSGLREGISLVQVTIPVEAAVQAMRNFAEVELAEPNFIYTHDVVSNDTYYMNGSLWGMYGQSTITSNIYGSDASSAWASGHIGSAVVYVGIIDEGYMYTHEDLAVNTGKNPGEVAGNGVDDDRNGYIDDVYGWDFYNNDNSVFDGVEDDHGTHVAGTIGAKGGNKKGVAGVCWNIKLLNAKFLGSDGGTTANAIKAVDYFTDLKINQKINIVALNNSWSGGGYSDLLAQAIRRAADNNILFIASAGNDYANIDLNPSYPASYVCENIISVSSLHSTGTLSYFSNYGAASVDLGAPGSGVYSTVPKLSRGKILSGYAMYSGTSMAAPHVTGAAALFASTHPAATFSEIKSVILGSVTPTLELTGRCLTGGRLNVSSF